MLARLAMCLLARADGNQPRKAMAADGAGLRANWHYFHASPPGCSVCRRAVTVGFAFEGS